jgi:hypothetical protein
MIPLQILEEITGRSRIAARIEMLLPIGVRGRQLLVRTLLLGILLALADHRPARLTRVHSALTSLPVPGQLRLGVITDWKHGPHQLTCRQTERTFGLVTDALARDAPDGLPSALLTSACDDLLEASIPPQYKDASSALAVDWTDLETFSRPPPKGTSDCADPEASWGHRKGGGPGQDSELFFGYYLNAATMMPDEGGPAVPELTRRATLSSCRHDPVPAVVPVLTALPEHDVPLGDILAGSGYAHRIPANWAAPLRAAGAQLIATCTPMTAARTATATAPSSATGTCTARPRRGHCWNPGRWPATPPPRKPLCTTARPPRPRSCVLQTRPHHRRRPRRLPPRPVPRRHGQDPLPPAPAVNEPGPGPARDPHPARAPARLL